MAFELTFERFSTSTVIRVFNFIRTSAFVAERIFWIAVLFGFSAATIWNVSETIKTYLSEPTASQVSIVSNSSGGGLIFPNAILCLEMNPDDLLNLYERRIETILNKVSTSSDLLATLRTKLDSVHEQEKQHATAFMASIDNSSIYTEQNLLLAYHQSEPTDVLDEDDVALLGLTSVMFFRLIGMEMQRSAMFPDWQSPAVKQLYDAYISEKTDFQKLFALIGEAVCVLFEIRIVSSNVDLQSASNQHTHYNVCQRSATMRFFGIYSRREMICYRLRGQTPFVFQSAFDYVTLTMHPRTFYRHLAGDLREITLDLSGYFQPDQQRSFLSLFNEKQTLEFALETESTLVDLRRRSCSARNKGKGTQAECFSWCRLEAIVAGCACMPLMRQLISQFAEVPSGLPSCAITLDKEYGNSDRRTSPCRQTLSKRFSTNCTQSCPQNCETFVFSGPEVLHDDQSLDFLNVTTAVKLVSAKFVYLEILEYVTMDGKAFVASLGGNLSLYLGASFLALIHIVVFIVRLPFERKGNAVQASSSTTQASSTTKAFEERLALLEERVNACENTSIVHRF